MQFFRLLLITFILTALTLAAEAQHTDSLRRGPRRERYSALLIGLSVGSYFNGEVGFARITNKRVGIEPVTWGWLVSDEIRFTNKLLMGPKIGVWGGNGTGLGLNMIYYTDFGNGTLVFRPEIGAAIFNFKLLYGYNFKLTNTAFNGINKMQVEMAIGIKL